MLTVLIRSGKGLRNLVSIASQKESRTHSSTGLDVGGRRRTEKFAPEIPAFS